MTSFPLLAALTVSAGPGIGCPDAEAITRALHTLGVAIREDADVHVRFRLENGKRTAVIEQGGAEPRTIEHEGADCSSLGEATVVLLSVLYDDRDRPVAAPRGTTSEAPAAKEDVSVVRLEAAGLFSSGVVAPFAFGATIGAAWRPLRWGSIGLLAETWPEREHASTNGTVTVGASSLALTPCVGRVARPISVEGCVLGHAGIYHLSATGFPVVRPTDRLFFGVEADLRIAFSLVKGFGVFGRAGLWLPFTRFDVAVRGADSSFRTTSLAPKGAIGFELNL